MPLLATKFKNEINKIANGAEFDFKVKNSKSPSGYGSEGCTGFIVNKATGKVVYVNTVGSEYGPLRGQIMYREAENTHDYTGGRNIWVPNNDYAEDIVKFLRS